MAETVSVIHPLTGKLYHMHPDLVGREHHWIHPDPAVPTPPESLPLFNLDAVDKLLIALARQPREFTQPTTPAEPSVKVS